MVRMVVSSAGPSLQVGSRHRERALKRCLLQPEALLLLQEAAAWATGSKQERGQSVNGERFIALVGS